MGNFLYSLETGPPGAPAWLGSGFAHLGLYRVVVLLLSYSLRGSGMLSMMPYQTVAEIKPGPSSGPTNI